MYVVTDDEVIGFGGTARAVRVVGRAPRTAPTGSLSEHQTLVPFAPPAWVLHTFAGVAAEADAELAARSAGPPGVNVRWSEPQR